MKVAALLKRLAKAERHVVESEKHVRWQRERVRTMEEAGHDSAMERRVLEQLIDMLATDRAECERLRSLRGGFQSAS
jgi:hypothetical protein